MKKGKSFGDRISERIDKKRPHIFGPPRKSWPEWAVLKTAELSIRGTAYVAKASFNGIYNALTPEELPDNRIEATEALWYQIAETPELDIPAIVEHVFRTIPRPLTIHRKILTDLLTPLLSPPPFDANADAIGHAQWRDRARAYLNLCETGKLEEITEPILRTFRLIDQHLPQPSKSPIRIPITDLVPNLPEAIEQTIMGFFSPYVLENNLYRDLRERLNTNATSEKGELIYPTKTKLEPRKLVDQYLKDTPLQRLFTARIPFEIPTERFRAHALVLAPSDYGKSQLYASLIRRFLDEGVGMCLLDPHGDLFKALKGRTPPERTIILDPSDYPPPLNVFDFRDATPIQVLNTFTYLMSSLAGTLSDKQSGIIPYLLKLIRVIPNATLQTLLDIVREKPIKDKPSAFLKYAEKLHPDDANYFKLQFFGNKMVETKEALGWKLAYAMSSDAFKQMFAAKTNSFDAYQAMQQNKIVLVKGGESVLGPHGLQVFMQLVVSQFFLAAQRRDAIPEKDRSTFLLFADEAQHIFNAQTTRILTESRKYGLGFIAATQLVKLIPPEVLSALMGSADIKIIGPVQFGDASALGREMHITSEDLMSLKPSSKGADWFAYHRRMPKAVRISLPHGALNNLPWLGLPLQPKREAPQSPPQPPEEPDEDIVW
jgi:hypothetical protein